jgi:site-specific recombinase XerD
LAAIHSFFRFVALEEPAHSGLCQRVLAVPSKRYDRALIAFLTLPEIDALLAVPDRTTWRGRRDYIVLLVAVQTGLRVSELIGLRAQDLVLETGAHVRCHGKGRKERCTPLTRQAVTALRRWLAERRPAPDDPVFPTAQGRPLSRDAVARLLATHTASARRTCVTLAHKRVSPHVLRHTTAMQLLLAGVDRALIALWLGHESVETTQVYLDADLPAKEALLAKTSPVTVPPGRYRPDDRLLAFLTSL